MERWLNKWGGWVLIGVLCAIPVVRWVQLVDVSAQLSTWYGFATVCAKVGALVGTMLYALNFILAIRSPKLEPLFGGLNRVYIAHHITGGLALVLLTIHPLFVSLRNIEWGVIGSIDAAAYALLPDSVQFSSVSAFLESMSINFGIIGFLGMVVLLICTFFITFSYQTWLKIHRFLGLAFLIAGLHVVYVWSDVRNDLPLRLYLVVWIGLGLAAFVHRSLLANIFVRRYRYRVSRVSHPASGVVTIGLEPQRKRLNFKAGQFVFVKFTSGPLKGETHPFSLTGKQGEHDKELEISVKALGDFTAKLQDVKEGNEALLEGAFGRFVPARYPGKKHVWIAGGIGITPFIAMAKAYETYSVESADLFYSVNSESEMINRSLFDALAAKIHSFTFHGFIAGGENGFLSAYYIEKTLGSLSDRVYFICGPPIMMKSIKNQLIKKGIPKHMIISEEFSIQ